VCARVLADEPSGGERVQSGVVIGKGGEQVW
jgi:hypothetical protein